ncbi:MAG: hypothetical protein LBF76_00445 [Holosporales bacterium]|jgi:hypothetical protein|nr:hypothetical protein [Holosporales bacterium]
MKSWKLVFISELLLAVCCDCSQGMLRGDDDLPQQQEDGKHHARQMFSSQEDERLSALVENMGTNNWGAIVQQMPGRNARQCRERYRNYLRPDINRAPWTPEEDQLLLEEYGKIGSKFEFISWFFPGRTGINVRNRYNRLRRRIKKGKGPFTNNTSALVIRDERSFQESSDDSLWLDES